MANETDTQNTGRLRVVTTIREGANPELWHALSDIPKDQRSERMRLLASVGAQLMGSGLIAVPVAAGSVSAPITPPAPPSHDLPDELKARFGQDDFSL